MNNTVHLRRKHLEIYTKQDEQESVIINTKGSNLILILLRNKKIVVLSTRVANDFLKKMIFIF